MDDLTQKRLEKQGIGVHRIEALKYLENQMSDEEKVNELMKHVVTQRQPIKRSSRFTNSDIPKIEIDHNEVKEIADKIKQDADKFRQELDKE